MTATAGHLFASVALGGAEAAAATARAGCIGVFDVKAAAHQVVDIVDLRTVDVIEARGVHVHPQSMSLVHFVAFARIITKHADEVRKFRDQTDEKDEEKDA